MVAGSGGSIKAAVEGVNKAGLSQADAVTAITRVTEASGRSVGGVASVEGGAKVLTGVVPGRGHVVHVTAEGTTTFGAADVAFAVDEAGNLVTTVTNVTLK